MIDDRVKRLAQLLVEYSLNIRKGDYFLISGGVVAEPLIEEVYRAAIKKGAHPEVQVIFPEMREFFYKYASDEQLDFVSPYQKLEADAYDAVLTIWGEENTRYLSHVDPKRIAKHHKALSETNNRFYSRVAEGSLRWCGTQFPTHADAQEASMSLQEYEDFVYHAGLLHKMDPIEEWKKVSTKQEKICNFLNQKKVLRIKSKDTDLSMRIEGRRWINCDGKENFPDGEVFTTPHRDSVNGKIRFSFPGIYMGKEIEDIVLVFKQGKVIEAHAAKGEDLLLALLQTDEGSAYVGEIAIGTNYGIQEFTRNMLFDEKIGGTCHLAIGSAPEETGGKNISSIHWDMLCDMQQEGEIFADDELFYQRGNFISPLLR